MAEKVCDTCRHFSMTSKGPHGICEAPAPAWTINFVSAVGYKMARETQATWGKECDAYSTTSDEVEHISDKKA